MKTTLVTQCIVLAGLMLASTVQASDTPTEVTRPKPTNYVAPNTPNETMRDARRMKSALKTWQERVVSKQDDIDKILGELNLDNVTKLVGEAQLKEQMLDLLGSWFGYVTNKCGAVSKEKAAISEGAALLGCEISEIAGLATEFESCLGGTSKSPYCMLKD